MVRAVALTREALLKRVGESVRELRVERGLSQEALAGKAALDRTYVGGVERGERNISVINLIKLARTLGVSGSDLLRGAGL